jgi:hypothetical protein
VIEGLSAVDAPKPVVSIFPDDFSDEMIPLKTEAIAAQAIKQPKVITNYRKHLKEEKLAREAAFIARYVAQRDKAHELIRKRLESTKRIPAQPGQQAIALGTELVIVLPRKAWRRL